MKAVVYEGKGKISLQERPMPQILDERDAIVKVTLTSICSSDLHIKHGAVPRAVPGTILGHEFVGEVVEVGNAVKKISPKDRVSVNVETFCGECFFCKRGFVNNCTDAQGGWALGCRIDGGQAEYVRIPFADHGLTVIPEHVTEEQALFNGDILSTGYWAAKIGEIKPADTVAVIGAGPTGLCTMLCARLYTPARILAIDTDESRLKAAAEHGLADLVLQAGKEDAETVIRDLTDGRGADVAIVDLDYEEAGRTARELAESTGRRVIALKADCTDQEQVNAMVEQVVKELGGLDFCHNNAGICINAPAEEMTFEQWYKVININLNGIFLTDIAAGKYMLAHGGGSIINTASMSAHIVNVPQPQCAYNASKAAVIQLTKSLAIEWAKRGVRVNSISPGYIGTELTLNSPALAPLIEKWNAMAPMGRMGRPEELEAICVYLAGDTSSFTTGSDFIIDGAFTCF